MLAFSFKRYCFCLLSNLCMCMHMSACAFGVQKRVLESLELEIQAIMNCLTWVLGTELRTSARAVKSHSSLTFTSPDCLLNSPWLPLWFVTSLSFLLLLCLIGHSLLCRLQKSENKMIFPCLSWPYSSPHTQHYVHGVSCDTNSPAPAAASILRK